MKLILLLLLFVSLTITKQKLYIECSDAYSEAEDAHSYFKRAYDAESLDSLTYYSKKAMRAFDDAMAYANDCGCDDANSTADDGYKYGKKAYNSETLGDGKYFAKRAIIAADEVKTYAEDCDEE